MVFFLMTWKKARVTPMFKNGDNSNLNHCRPCSILPTISKIFELHIARQLHAFFKATHVFHKFSLVSATSIQTALIHLVDDWLSSIDFGQYAGAVFLDLSQAFDLVDHRVLLHKLKLYHVTPKTITFMKDPKY